MSLKVSLNNLSSGIILLDKSIGISSNTAMQRIRRSLKIKTMGHTGTLDPMATGMLPLCFGRATRLCSYFLEANKTYEAEIYLGEKRSTGDQEGAILEIKPVPEFSPEKLENVLNDFLGVQFQIPPMYSALKKDGQPLYKLARAGIEIERQPREINIFKIELLDILNNVLKIQVTCSSGTYIRTLGEDIAKALGTVGYLKSLRRLSCGNFLEENMHTEQALINYPEDKIISLEQALNWPIINLTQSQINQLLQGKSPEILMNNLSGMVFLRSQESLEIIGFGEVSDDELQWRKFLIH